MVAAVCSGNRGLLIIPDRPDDRRAERLRPLAHDEPDTAGRGVDQNGVTALDFVNCTDQHPRRQALEHHCGGLLGRYLLGQFYYTPSVN
jgi:hypothetical protein